MTSQANAGKLLVVGVVALFGLLCIKPSAVSADTLSTTTATTTQAQACVDGSIKTNLVQSRGSTVNIFNIHTINNAPLCDDVTVYVSDYIMPANYNGNGFGDPTSYPQQLYKSVSAVLAKGTDGTITLEAPLPDACNNTQVDLYYAPEITTIGRSGQASQYIAGYIIRSTGACQTGGLGGGDTPTPVVTPVAATPQVLGASTVAPAAATLTDTGLPLGITSAFGVVLMTSALVVGRKKTVKA